MRSIRAALRALRVAARDDSRGEQRFRPARHFLRQNRVGRGTFVRGEGGGGERIVAVTDVTNIRGHR